MKKIVLFLLFFFSLSLAFGQTINYEDNNGPVTLSQGNSENGKNTYSGMDGGFTISVEWSGSRWEIFIEGPGVSRYVAFFSNENTALDPPNFTVGNWVDAEPPSGDPNAPTGDGTSLVAFSGSGTTNMVIAGCTDAAAPQINCPSIPGTEEVTLSFLTAFAPQTYNWTITETSGSMSQVAQGSVELTQAGIAGTAMPSLTCGQDYDVVITFSGTAPNAFTVTISGVEVITAGNVTSNDGVVNNGSSFTFSVPNCAGSTDFEVDNDAGMCSAMVSNLIATATDDCTANPTITHTITGATSGGGGDNASGIFNVGTSTVTFTAEDDENKMNTCSFDVIVSDTENPTASNPAGINVSCPEAVPAADPAVVTTEMDNCSAIVAFVEDTDNGGSGCMGSPLIITREYSVSDPSSNSISVFQTITVEDNTPPTASNPAPVNVSCFGDIPANDPTIVMDEMDNCTAGIVVAYVTDISNGGLGSGTDPFIITRTYRVTDCNGNGNSIDVTQTITVSDSEKPMVTCPGDVMQQVDAGETFATVNNIALTTSDNCAASPTVTYGIGGATTVPPATPGDASGTEFNLGMSTVTYSSADAAGNINTCSFTVTVTAAPTPEIEVMANSSTLTDGVSTSDFGNVNIDGGTATTTFTISNTGTADLILDANPVSVTGSSAFNSTQPALLMIPPNGNTSFTITFNPGNNQCEFQTAAVSIASNDADEDPFNFNVEGNGVDNVNPTLTCPTPPSAVDNDPDKCSAVVNGLAPSGVNDNCTPPIVTYALTGATTGSGNNDASGEAFNVGTTTVTYTVDDGTNMVTCNFDVVVNDTEDPKIDCSAIDVTRDADADECSFTMPGTGFDPTFNDNCPGASISNNFNNMASLAGAEFPVGTTTVIWTVTDAATRTATCTIMIEVTDAEDPTIDCSAIDVTRDSDPDECSFTMPGTGFDPTFADNCPGASISNDFNNMSSLAGVEFPVATTTVIWTVTDAAMRTATCTIMIEVTDVEDPTITCPDAPAAVSNDPDECFAIVNGLLPLDLDDNCTPPVATYELTGATTGMGNDDASGTMFNVGTTTVTYTVSDGVNTGDCSFDVVVNDTEDPTIDCSSIMEMRDADAGECSFTMPGTGFDPAFEDNCTGASTSNDYNNMSSLAGAEFPVGTTTVIWTVTDAAMRTATCTIMIEISDAENPTISCPSNATVSNDLGVCNAVVNGIAPTSSDDNCPSPTIAYTLTGATTGSGTDDASGETFDVGTTTVTYTITDASMNTGNCSFDVTVNDGEAPNMVCNNFSVDVTDATGGVTISAGQVDGGSMDNCAIIALSATPSSFNCSTLGAQTVTLTGFDAAGNSMSCTGTITVNDATSCGCGNPQPGDMCDDADATTENDVIQANCGCIGTPICDIAITGVLSTPETCDGENDATIVINASCTTCASILYSIDGGTTTQVSNLFGNLSDGTYMPYVVDSGDPGCNDTATDEVIDPGAALPDDPIPGPATRAFCASEGLNAELDNTGIRVSNLGADEKVVWILKTAPSGSAYTADQVLTPAGCPVGFTDLGELAIASGSRVIRVEDVENALPGTYTFEAYLENCTTGCISNTVGGFSITVYAAPTVDITADPDGAICLGTTDVMYDATIMSTDGGTYSYAWCAYNATNGGGTCFGGFTPGGDNASQMRSWTSSPGAKSVGVEIMSEFPGCIASTIYNFQVVNTPPEPIADKTDGSLCVGQDAATVFVDDPGMNREIVWVILEAPAGASFAMDDELEPNVNASDYRTDLDANGRRLRIKNNAAVGTYRFKAKTRETSLGCESDPTTEEFTITVNETPAVPTIDRQDLVRCRRETATISVLPTTDVEFVWEVLEAPNGVSFAAGDRLEPGVDGSDYRTDLQADGRELRTKGSARAGLYRFKVLARDINTGCESELTADELSILINDLPMVPTPDVDMAMGCAGSTGADVSVVDPMDSDLEVSWEVLEAPAGATISMGDILAPGTADSHYRTTVPNEPYTLRIKSNNSVTPGTYRFKAFFTNASTGCVGDATTAEFVIEINENPADPVAGVATKEFCNGDVDMPSLANTGISVSNTLTADEKVVWVLTSAPAGSAYAMDDEFTTDNCGDPFKNFGELTVANSSKVIRVQDIANAPIGTYTFDAFITNCVTGCSSEPVSGFSITVNETPAIPTVNRLTRASCVGSTSTVSVLDPGTGLKISWEVVAAPAGASFAAGDVLDANVDGPDYRTDLDANGMRLRIKGAMSVAVGTYQFKAKAINPATGCESELTTEVFEINIFAQPTVDISADPDGDLCLGQLDVMYDATITSTDGGTYTFDWCAYNSGDGSGTCFGGFDDNTIQMPKRSWTTSAGPKSVGVTVMSDVQGCMATDLYSFEVVAPTMLACPANQTVTLITNPGSFDCLAEATFNNPTIIPGPCDPVMLTISVDGGAPETVVAGESYTAMFQELGVFTVTYDSEDAVGNTSTCSFDISVDGLPCGFVDNGGLGCNTSTSMFDQGTETFSLTSDCAPNTMLYIEDASAFVFTELCGDGEITARVTGLSGTGFAGVMLRESEVANAKKMALGTNTIDRLRREVRVIDGYPSSAAEILSLNQFWIRVVRSGDTFSAFASADGIFWQPYLSQVIIMGDCVLAGLYTYTEKPGNAVTATFENVSVTGLANLGAPIDIGVQGLGEGLSLESEEGFKLYPNPTNGELNLDLSSFLGEAVDIRIFNALGQIVRREQIEEVQVRVERFDVSRLEAGMYNVVVKVGERLFVERVVVE